MEELQSQKFKQTMKVSNPLNDIAANLGVTPKVLTQLATGDDKEFRELVRGIFNILPENEVVLVASDPDINPEFLNYLCQLFEGNHKVLLTILQNPSSNQQTRQHILDHLPQETLAAFAKNPKTPPTLMQMITEYFKGDTVSSSSRSDEFKIKMKVSKLLNDLEANLGVTIEAFMKIRAKDDEQSREFVGEVYNALSENHVLIVSRDTSTTPKILNYLCQLFDSNPKVLLTILCNPTTDDSTRHFILERLSEKDIVSLASNPNTPPELLSFLGQYFSTSEDIQMVLLANSATPAATKKTIQAEPDAEIEEVTEDQLIIEQEEPVSEEESVSELEQVTEERLITDFFASEAEEEIEPAVSDEIDAKVALCVDKLYDINADIVTEFIKKARSEILKRLNLIAKANRLILRTIVNHPSLTIEELDNINMDMFALLLKRSPDTIDDKTVLKLIQQAKKKKKMA